MQINKSDKGKTLTDEVDKANYFHEQQKCKHLQDVLNIS